MDSEDRHSEAPEVELITDPEAKAHREAKNVLRQFDLIVEQIEHRLHPERPYKLRASAILALNRTALEGLSPYAGNYRPTEIEIKGSGHKPPPPHLVPELVEGLCKRELGALPHPLVLVRPVET